MLSSCFLVSERGRFGFWGVISGTNGEDEFHTGDSFPGRSPTDRGPLPERCRSLFLASHWGVRRRTRRTAASAAQGRMRIDGEPRARTSSARAEVLHE